MKETMPALCTLKTKQKQKQKFNDECFNANGIIDYISF